MLPPHHHHDHVPYRIRVDVGRLATTLVALETAIEREIAANCRGPVSRRQTDARPGKACDRSRKRDAIATGAKRGSSVRNAPLHRKLRREPRGFPIVSEDALRPGGGLQHV